MPIVVLSGGIASGKTTVSDRLQSLGIPVIDTDQLARAVVVPGSPGLAAVAAAFGPQVLQADGALDRKALSQRVFADPAARQQLEGLLHPLIESAARDRISRLTAAPFCVLVVPLLVESGLFSDADLVVVVDAAEDVQRSRLRQRDGLDDQSIEQILAAQATRQERLARADLVIHNSGSLVDLNAEVGQLCDQLLQRYSAES